MLEQIFTYLQDQNVWVVAGVAVAALAALYYKLFGGTPKQ